MENKTSTLETRRERKHRFIVELTEVQIDAIDMAIVSRKRELKHLIKIIEGKELRKDYQKDLDALKPMQSFFLTSSFKEVEA